MNRLLLLLLCLLVFKPCHSLELPFNPEGPNRIGYLEIGRDHQIDASTVIYVQFALEHFKSLGTPFVVLDLNTPGGEVFAALKIVDMLQKLEVNDHIPVVAFIDNWALSAGAMLAYSSKYIATVKGGSMGAAEPVTVGGEGKVESASEKVNSALRAEIANLARSHGRNPLLAEAMVDKDILLVKRGGEIVRVEEESQILPTDQLITRKGKLLTLDGEQLIEYHVADLMVPQAPVSAVTAEELANGEWPAQKNLLFHDPSFAKIPNATLVSYSDWRVGFFAFLTHPLVSSLLFMGLAIGVYLEMSHPGLGLPGLVALICLALILLSSFAVQAASWLELIILAVGVLLLLVEIFILPGFGAFGIIGILLTLAGLFALMLPFDFQAWHLYPEVLWKYLSYFSGAVIATLVTIFLLARFFARTPLITRRLVLTDSQEPFIVTSLPPAGSEGIALSPLRPSGKIEVNHQVYDAITEGSFIDKGAPLTIIRQEGSKLIVRQS
jgi:membrane-bound serine protease (ClpP class)